MNKKIILSVTVLALISGCATAPEKEREKKDQTAFINDYPTRDRVEYVFNCIAKHGGLTGSKAFINQYACGCKIDKIAEKLTFIEYEDARTFSYLKKIPGEKGGAFRDPAQSKDLRTRLKEAEKYAESQCFVM